MIEKTELRDFAQVRLLAATSDPHSESAGRGSPPTSGLAVISITSADDHGHTAPEPHDRG